MKKIGLFSFFLFFGKKTITTKQRRYIQGFLQYNIFKHRRSRTKIKITKNMIGYRSTSKHMWGFICFSRNPSKSNRMDFACIYSCFLQNVANVLSGDLINLGLSLNAGLAVSFDTDIVQIMFMHQLNCPSQGLSLSLDKGASVHPCSKGK